MVKRPTFLLISLAVLSLACNLERAATPTSPAAPTPPPPTPPGGSEKRCGDGICDGPENTANCPEDCPAAPTEQAAPVSGAPIVEPGPEEETYWVTNPASGARLYVQVLHPQDWSGEPMPTLVLVPGGTGDSSAFLEPMPRAQLMADDGFTIVLLDPDGRGKSEGSEDQNGYAHQDGLAAVIRFAATLPEVDEQQIGLVSYSYGVTMAAGALARHDDLPVRFLVDWEGPANRNDTGGCDEAKTGHLQGHPCDDEDFWREREASTFALNLRLPYQRLQSEEDHAQPDNDHALTMIANATAEQYGGHGKAPWTRLNDLTPNTVYTVDAPPPMIPEADDRRLEALVVQYAQELLNMP
jgi:pimeloyl-ACP methyl ester carboxylesterase